MKLIKREKKELLLMKPHTFRKLVSHFYIRMHVQHTCILKLAASKIMEAKQAGLMHRIIFPNKQTDRQGGLV